MSQRGSKILGLLIFLLILSSLFFIALMPSKMREGKHIKSINLSGNRLLPQVSYLSFAKLNEGRNLSEITLPILKSRLEKHPFVSSAEIELSKSNDAKIYLNEKNPDAIIIINNQTFLLSDELQLLPLYSNTKFVDLPIINNPKHAIQFRILEYLHYADIIEAHSILYLIKNLNKEMFRHLSEINLNNGDDITLTFSGIRPIIKFGRNEVEKKLLNLNAVWVEIKDEANELSQSDYVDLRLTNQIYFGKAEQLKKEI